MPNFCWSWTAPTVTQEQVEAEKAALTEEEQRQIQNDLHGAYEPIEETPQLIADKIDEMRQHINAIEDEDKESYLVAQEKCAEYCNSEEFQLMFLRADKFDAEKAASRLVSYWDEKLDLFGPDKTYKRLSVNDLLDNPGDVEILKSGAFYSLPNKDEAGRGILFLNRSKMFQPQFDRESKKRVLFYTLHCLLEDDEMTQKKGFVLVALAPDDVQTMRGFDRKVVIFCWKALRDFLPARLAAYHHPVPARSFASLLLPVINQMMGQENRQRFVAHRFHQTMREMGKNMKKYGIKEDHLPNELGGAVSFDYDAWLEKRRAIEEAR